MILELSVPRNHSFGFPGKFIGDISLYNFYYILLRNLLRITQNETNPHALKFTFMTERRS